MTSSKLDDLKDFLAKDGGGGGGDGGGEGGGPGTVATVESSGFTPTFSGGSKKTSQYIAEEGSQKEEDASTNPTSFAKSLVDWAKDMLAKDYGIDTPNEGNTALSHTPNDEARGRTRSADISLKPREHVISPPEVPFEKDPVLNWDLLFQKAVDEDINLSTKVLIRDNSGKILILKDAYSDWWDLPGGHLHDAEEPEKGAGREVYEETQLQLNNMDQVMAKELMLGSPGEEEARVVLFFVSYLSTDGVDPHLSEEHTDFAWVDMISTHYYNLGVFGPVIRYIMRFIFEGDHLEDNPYVAEQSRALATLDNPVVIGKEGEELTVLEQNGQVNLVKPDGRVYRQIEKAEPWPSSEEEGDLLPVEEDDFLEKDRVYLHPGDPAPQGVQVQTGPSGGKFYDSQGQTDAPQMEGENRGQKQPGELEQPHPERIPGSTTDFAQETDIYRDMDGNDATDRTLARIGMDKEEYRTKGPSGSLGPDLFVDSEDIDFAGDWMGSSLGGHAVAMQYAAADIFSSSAERVDKVGQHFEHDPDLSDENKQRATKYLKDTYANTQRSLEERGIKNLKLYRGMDISRGRAAQAGERVGIKDLPLSSWTADPSTAQLFGNQIVSRDFDARDIVMSCLDKLPADEFEFVVHTPDTGFEATIAHIAH